MTDAVLFCASSLQWENDTDEACSGTIAPSCRRPVSGSSSYADSSAATRHKPIARTGHLREYMSSFISTSVIGTSPKCSSFAAASARCFRRGACHQGVTEEQAAY